MSHMTGVTRGAREPRSAATERAKGSEKKYRWNETRQRARGGRRRREECSKTLLEKDKCNKAWLADLDKFDCNH